jgi:hypothetical protein
MAANLTRLTHKIAIKLHLLAESLPCEVLAPGGQSGNLWIHPRSYCYFQFIMLGYVLDDRGPRVRLTAGAGNFSLHHRVQNGSGTHPASYPMGTRDSFLGVKRPGVKLTIHLHLVPRSKNYWSYTSTPPIRLYGVVLS